MFQEFKAFIMRGNVVDLSVGVIIGGAFGAVVKSLVNDVVMPPIGLLLGRVDFANLFITLKMGDPGGPYATLVDAQAAGAVSINYGTFLNTIVSLLITGLAVFFLVRGINRMQREKTCRVPVRSRFPAEAVVPTNCRSVQISQTISPAMTKNPN